MMLQKSTDYVSTLSHSSCQEAEATNTDFAPFERVEYQSTKMGGWIRATVKKCNDDGTFDLSVKPNVKRCMIRKFRLTVNPIANLTSVSFLGQWCDSLGNRIDVISTDAFNARLVAFLLHTSGKTRQLNLVQLPSGCGWQCGNGKLDLSRSQDGQLYWVSANGCVSRWVRPNAANHLVHAFSLVGQQSGRSLSTCSTATSGSDPGASDEIEDTDSSDCVSNDADDASLSITENDAGCSEGWVKNQARRIRSQHPGVLSRPLSSAELDRNDVEGSYNFMPSPVDTKQLPINCEDPAHVKKFENGLSPLLYSNLASSGSVYLSPSTFAKFSRGSHEQLVAPPPGLSLPAGAPPSKALFHNFNQQAKVNAATPRVPKICPSCGVKAQRVTFRFCTGCGSSLVKQDRVVQDHISAMLPDGLAQRGRNNAGKKAAAEAVEVAGTTARKADAKRRSVRFALEEENDMDEAEKGGTELAQTTPA